MNIRKRKKMAFSFLLHTSRKQLFLNVSSYHHDNNGFKVTNSMKLVQLSCMQSHLIVCEKNEKVSVVFGLGQDSSS